MSMKIRVLCDFRDPAGPQKSTTNRSGTEKVHPETAPEAVFIVFSCSCRSESFSGPIFGDFIGLSSALKIDLENNVNRFLAIFPRFLVSFCYLLIIALVVENNE